MARSWQYPRWRRYVMQATMWLLLAATVGLAALVNHERRRAMRVELGPPIADGWLVARLPATWQASPAGAERDARVIARAVEPDSQGLGRTVTITRDRLTSPISPLEYLLFGSRQVLGLDLAQARRGNDQRELVEPIHVGGWPGVMVRGVRAASRGGGGGGAAAGPGSGSRKEIYAATVLPSGHAVVVKLEGDRPAELSDVEIVKQLAGAIEIGGQPTLGQPGETIALEGGIRLSAPQGFRPVYENDEHLLSRRLWPDGDVMQWSAAALVPCVLSPPAGSSDEALAIRALAATYDASLRDATVTPAGARRWRITAPASSAGLRAVRGYLLADELGDAGTMTAGPRRAVMAFFHGTPPALLEAQGEGNADAAWESIARGVSFVGRTDFATMFEAGAAEVVRIRTQGLASVLGASAGDAWWIWWDGLERKHVGWTHTKWHLTRLAETRLPPSGGTTRGAFRGADGRAVRAKWSWTGELRRYDAFNSRLPPPPEEAVMRHTLLGDGKVSIELASGGRPVARGAGEVPAQFLPGAWAAMLLGKLSPQPMIVRTDSFLPGEPIGAPLPLTLIVEPITEKPAPAPAPAAGPDATAADGTPLRCLTVRVNGAGESSRWYFTAGGELHHASFARQLRLNPSDEKTVLFNFDPEVTAPW